MLRSCAITNTKCQRKFCDMVSSKITNDATTEVTKAKSFESIPGPKGIFGMGTLMQYSPLIGEFSIILVFFFSPPNAARKHIGLYLIFFFNLHVICPTGTYDWNEIHKAGFVKHAKWGRIVKERMVPGVDVVWLFDPNDISKVLNNSGPNMYPQRKSHLGLQKYRKDRPHIYKTGGLLPTYAHAHSFTYLFILFYKSNRMNIMNKICV